MDTISEDFVCSKHANSDAVGTGVGDARLAEKGRIAFILGKGTALRQRWEICWNALRQLPNMD
jgi:hypothetical protein